MEERNLKKKVLIVEDNLILALTLEQLVHEIGHFVIDKVASGEKAIPIAKKQMPDIILMDIQLEGAINGIETLLKVQQTVDIPAIYITGNSDKIKQRDLCKTNYIEFLTKPILMSDLKNAFKQLQ